MHAEAAEVDEVWENESYETRNHLRHYLTMNKCKYPACWADAYLVLVTPLGAVGADQVPVEQR